MTSSDRLADRFAIADLIHGYAQRVRWGRTDTCAELFTEDGSFAIRETDPTDPAGAVRTRTTLSGKAEVGAYLAKTAGSGARICPMISNLIVEVGDGEARSGCVMMSRTWPPGHETIGEYADSFRRVDGHWLFASRAFTLFVSSGGANG